MSILRELFIDPNSGPRVKGGGNNAIMKSIHRGVKQLRNTGRRFTLPKTVLLQVFVEK